MNDDVNVGIIAFIVFVVLLIMGLAFMGYFKDSGVVFRTFLGIVVLVLVIFIMIKGLDELTIRSELKNVTKEVEDEWDSKDKGRVEVESKKEKETSKSIMNDNVKGGLGVLIVVVVLIAGFALMGAFQENSPASTPLEAPTPSKRPIYSTPTPTPPLSTISDNVKEINIEIGIRESESREVKLMSDIEFKDKYGRLFSKLEDGRTRIKIEEPGKDEEIIDIKAGEKFNELDTPFSIVYRGARTLKFTIILPNGKTAYGDTLFDYNSMFDDLCYSYYYRKGERDSDGGYSAKIPWNINEYCSDGYTDGYIGATPRYRYSPIRLTIPVK